MKSGEFITLSACSMTLTALGIDIMLPALAEVRRHYGLNAESTAPSQVISFFFLGQVAQIVFGILSDRHGRLPVLRIGFPLYIMGGIAAVFAPTLNFMLASRFICGMGASAVFMTTLAGVRDRYSGDQMARILSFIFTIFLFTPVIAPFLGIAILTFASWQFVFITPPVFAIVIFIWSFRLEESLPPAQRSAPGWMAIRSGVGKVLSNKTFLRYTGITTMLFVGLSSYVASSEHIVGDIFGRPELFAWIFAAIGLVMSLCAFLNAYLSAKFGASITVRWLLVCYTVIAVMLVISMLFFGDPPPLGIFFVMIAMLMAINITVEPNSSSLALEPMGEIAGMASSIYGTAFFFIGASLGSVISHLLVKTVYPMAIAFLLIGLVTVTLAATDKARVQP